MKKVFKIPDDKSMVADMTERMIAKTQERVLGRQLGFYAFLNREFNIMNFKSARCSMHCFDSTDKPLAEVNTCLGLCREGIQDCRQYAYGMQKQAEADLADCHAAAKEQKNLSDPVVHWASCYEKLIQQFDGIEKGIKVEFSNYI